MTTSNKFKPSKAVNAKDHMEKITFMKLLSDKRDGIRCLFKEGNMMSIAFNLTPNKQLQEKFSHMKAYSLKNNIILDGELYGHNLTFGEINRVYKTEDFSDEKTVKKIMKEKDFCTAEYWIYVKDLIESIEFYCFDVYQDQTTPFHARNIIIQSLGHLSFFNPVEQTEVYTIKEVEDRFEAALKNNYEGLILRDPNAVYKFGRSTLNDQVMLKIKPFDPFDGKIVGVEQATEVDPNAEKTKDKLGRSVTSKKKEDRIPVEKASAFIVEYEDTTVKVSIAATDEKKKYYWEIRDSLIGDWICYKGMTVGMKDVPRHGIFQRFREAKE